MKSKKRKVLLGVVGVDSGQLVICDPGYLEDEYDREDENTSLHPVYQHKDGSKWQFCDTHFGVKPSSPDVKPFPGKFDQVIKKYGKSPTELIKSGDFVKVKPNPEGRGKFSYNGICRTTLETENQGGQLYYKMGHAGAGVAFSTGFGDGVYNVYAELVETKDYGERVSKVWVEFITPKEISLMNKLTGRGK